MNTFLNYINVAIVLLFFSAATFGDELVQKFKNPSFSGVNQSAHYLTIENQEKSRRDDIVSALEAAERAALREEDNTTMAKFIRNLESRIFAQLSKQLVENMFSNEAAANFGSFVLEGNTVTYMRTTCGEAPVGANCSDGQNVIVLIITDDEGSETIITIPIGEGGF